MPNREYRPSLAQLRTFVTIAENRHFGTAAEKLQISQPSLSQALAALETGLGVQLIERSTRKVIVTPIGQSLLPYAKATLDAAEAFFIHSHGKEGELTGPLVMGLIPTAAPYLLPHLLPLLQEQFPELEPHLVEDRTDRLLADLKEGRIDVALMALPSEATGMVDDPLYTERFVVVTPEFHPLAGQRGLGLDILNRLQLLLLDEGHCLHDQIIDLCRKAEMNPSEAASAVARASSLTTIVQLVIANLGSTLLPISAVEAECSRPGVALAEFSPAITAERQVGLVYRSSSSRKEDFNQLGALISTAYRKAEATGQAVLEAKLSRA